MEYVILIYRWDDAEVSGVGIRGVNPATNLRDDQAHKCKLEEYPEEETYISYIVHLLLVPIAYRDILID